MPATSEARFLTFGVGGDGGDGDGGDTLGLPPALTCGGVAAAIANAVHHATGRRIRSLPITIEDLL